MASDAGRRWLCGFFVLCFIFFLALHGRTCKRIEYGFYRYSKLGYSGGVWRRIEGISHVL